MPTNSLPPLHQVRVLDASRVLAGPFCGKILGDLGAEVIKVERPRVGDDSRAFGPPWVADKTGEPTRDSAYFTSANRGKKSITVNIAKSEGQALVRALAAKCDVLIEKPDGAPGGGPQRAGVPIADIITGMYASIAICAALASRAETGRGQHLDLALLDSQIALLAYQNTNYFATGKPPARIGNLHPNIVPYQPFRASDGEVIVACGNDNLFRKFCEAAGRPELADDPRFATNGKRVENRGVMTRAIQEFFGKRSKAEWLERLEAAGVPNGPINDLAQVFQEPQVKARGMKIELEHAAAGKLPLVASPMRFSATPLDYRLAPPLLGEHTEEVLKGLLGKGDAEIAKLRADGVV